MQIGVSQAYQKNMETFIEDIIETTITTTDNSINIDNELLKNVERVMIIVKPIIFIFIIVVGGIGNGLVLYVVAKNKYMRSPKKSTYRQSCNGRHYIHRNLRALRNTSSLALWKYIL